VARLILFCESPADASTVQGLVERVIRPCQEAHRLDAKKEHARKSPKRVLDTLTSGVREREGRCWTATSLTVMSERGQHSGLAAFLNEVKTLLLPRLTGGS
jgi:hypothetical protein